MSNSGGWWNKPKTVTSRAIISALSLNWNQAELQWGSKRFIQDQLCFSLPCPQQILRRGSPTASSCSSSASETWSSSLGTLVIHRAPLDLVATWTAFWLSRCCCIFRPPVGAVPWRHDGAGFRGGGGCCQARLHHQVQWHQCWCESFLPQLVNIALMWDLWRIPETDQIFWIPLWRNWRSCWNLWIVIVFCAVLLCRSRLYH